MNNIAAIETLSIPLRQAKNNEQWNLCVYRTWLSIPLRQAKNRSIQAFVGSVMTVFQFLLGRLKTRHRWQWSQT